MGPLEIAVHDLWIGWVGLDDSGASQIDACPDLFWSIETTQPEVRAIHCCAGWIHSKDGGQHHLDDSWTCCARNRINLGGCLKTRQQFDRIAWRIITHKKAPRGAKPGVTRPHSLPAILYWMRKDDDTFELSFHDFLDEFYLHKKASFFRQEPLEEFTPRQRALCAATAEYLCRRFNLPCPRWTKKPEYVLVEEWSPIGIKNRRKAAP